MGTELSHADGYTSHNKQSHFVILQTRLKTKMSTLYQIMLIQEIGIAIILIMYKPV
jgi:hypothetical protein